MTLALDASVFVKVCAFEFLRDMYVPMYLYKYVCVTYYYLEKL